MSDPFATLARRQRSMIRNALEQEALYEARVALETTDTPPWWTPGAVHIRRAEAAAAVLESYRTPLERLWEQDRLDKEASA